MHILPFPLSLPGLASWVCNLAPHTWKGPTLGRGHVLICCCCHLEILTNFWTKGFALGPANYETGLNPKNKNSYLFCSYIISRTVFDTILNICSNEWINEWMNTKILNQWEPPISRPSQGTELLFSFLCPECWIQTFQSWVIGLNDCLRKKSWQKGRKRRPQNRYSQAYWETLTKKPGMFPGQRVEESPSKVTRGLLPNVSQNAGSFLSCNLSPISCLLGHKEGEQPSYRLRHTPVWQWISSAADPRLCTPTRGRGCRGDPDELCRPFQLKLTKWEKSWDSVSQLHSELPCGNKGDG